MRGNSVNDLFGPVREVRGDLRNQLVRRFALLLCAASAISMPALSHAGTKQPESVLGVECAKIYELGIDKQENLRATLIRVGCGLEPGGFEGEGFPGEAEGPNEGAGPTNVNSITGTETWPKVTQSESMVWGSPDGQTIVVNYNDSSTSPGNYSGVSVSTDSGASFTRLLPSPFASGHGTNYGDPIVVYNVALSKWFAGDIASRGDCGNQGIGLWTSTNGVNWSTGACAHNGGSDDRESMWVDNNAASPFFGRMYIAWNDYARGQSIFAVHSDDGVVWTAPVQVSPGSGLIRTIQVTGNPTDGTVFVAGMNEGAGGVSPRTNLIYRSNNGGETWTQITMGPQFTPPGEALCGYFAAIPPIWRHMGWGQPGVGPANVVHYAYAARGTNPSDIGDILYTRSLDNGDTWSTPIVLNSDAALGGARAQWMPSLSATSDGKVQVSWYDRRNSTDGTNYEYWGIQSFDNGSSWGADFRISDVLIPQPQQPDSDMVGCLAGDYNYHSSNGLSAFVTWTDGRNLITGRSQQDVYFAGIPYVVTGGVLEGDVTAEATGAPIAGARVRALGGVDRSTNTNPTGHYSLRLPEDTYSVTASAFGFQSRTVDGVRVVEGETTTQSLSLASAPSHRLSGTVVSNLSGAPLPNVEVRILSTPLPPVRTDKNGVYEFPSVPDGSYNVQAAGGGRCLSSSTLPVDISDDTTLNFGLVARVDSFGYSCDDGVTFSWNPGDTLLALQGDDASQSVPLPFPFTFYGQTYSTLHVSTNGNGNFIGPDTTYVNPCIPSPSPPNAYLGPLFTDLLVNRPAGVYTKVQGNPGSRQFIIEWRDVTFFGAPGVATFEIILNEADNSIIYQYNRADIRGDGSTATIGIENQTGTVGFQYSCREAVVSVGKAIRFFLAQ